jgi:DNA-binding GntR family transcriptional regulator
MGTLSAGDRVSDFALAAEIGISRTPVREAISQLQSDGLIEQVPHVGAFVRKLSRREMEELYDLRAQLEGYAAEQAATRMTDKDIEEAGHLCDDMHTMIRGTRHKADILDDALTERLVKDDIGFHMLILRACGNRQVAKIVSDFHIMTRLCGKPSPDPRMSPLCVLAATWHDHARVFRGLRHRSPEMARRWMTYHILQAKNGALHHFDQLESEAENRDDRYPDSVQTLLAQMERYQPATGMSAS